MDNPVRETGAMPNLEATLKFIREIRKSRLQRKIESEIRNLFAEIEKLQAEYFAAKATIDTAKWARYICKKNELVDKINLLTKILK
jgi:hypothetical protein